MAFATCHYIVEEDCEDFSDVPLKLHSFLEFLDAGLPSTDGSNTEQHVSSNISEKSEGEWLESDIRHSLRGAPLKAAADRPRRCYCLDDAHCICGQFFLPPLLTRNAAGALPPLTHGLATSGSEADAVDAAHTSSTATMSSFGEPMYISLCPNPVKLATPVPVISLTTMSMASASTTTTGCRC
ncbi:hypothetical protein conserved [Leishmania donovani]|uniref:Uncharacterized protein n=3 Tax=Leishmania donovani species complex TaxID=38574 RepID=A4HWB2_LEIIN|nr:hypothetical protein, unknown function [Leishmania infantum JPCM5]TPP53098.1 hypothetical protein CGC20_29970 [Leishmania donovani]CAC9470944.1 hypothetical_protein_-_conserved [Leishmania infantum]CAJ1987440.1 hypothetical protein conserved [Leishmania donovani]CAM66735.1 hypothetical protein, unknown function [Leishmania infantum JPCM5]SUZ40406.1 hypothetical_protein_-_conserved [Leishmania infantum]|eukprot:XP_001464353.1 hypothetical protein, unknown function [Leishmania infantum JPCM5]